jgi:hypothetical protein
MNRFAIIAAWSAGLLPTLAGAASITETDAFSVDTTTGISSDALTFGQFSSALGTLTGVTFELTGSANAVFGVATNSTSAFTGTGNSSTNLQLSGTGFNTVASPTLTSSVTNGAVNASSSSATYVETYFPGSTSQVDLLGTVGSGSLASYIGSGSATVLAQFPSFTASGSFTNPVGTFAGAGGGAQASGDISVTYTYTPVPIPPALTLLLSGALGLGAFARRNRSFVKSAS